jgi:Spy/CpxP family protein refolding chaperone
MKKILIACLLLVNLAYTATAQDDGVKTGEGQEMRKPSKDRINPRILEQLSLSAAQQEQIKVINDDYRSKMQEMIKSDIAPEDRKSKRKDFDAGRAKAIMGILSAEQKEKLTTLQNDPKLMEKEGEFKHKSKEDGEKTKMKTDDEKTKIKVKSDK